jgi:polysaccharide biosynthesis transport protein
VFIGLTTPEDYLRVIKNHPWMICVPIVVSVALAGLLYQWLPKSYRASTLINFEAQKVMHIQGVGVSGTEQGSDRPDPMASHITAMREVLYKRKLLTQVAEEFHLYGYTKESATAQVDDYVTAKMRAMVQLDSKEVPFLRVSFADPQPAMARDVTMRLAELFIEENMKSREVIAESSTEFLQHELDIMKAQLEVKERALMQFKQAHLGQLPEQMTANLHALDRLETESTAQQELEKALNLRIQSIDRAIREYEDPTSEASPIRAVRDPRLTKIKELERTLAGLRSMYKESYPDVARVRNEMMQLQAMTTEDYVALYVEQETVGISNGAGTAKRKAVDPYKAELMKQREEALNQLQLVQLRQARIAADMKKFEGRIDGTAIHQQELMGIQRDYENLQKNYHALLEKKLNVGIAGDLEKKRQGVQMRIIDPARLPGMPEKPNLIFIMLGGLGVGCALGFGSAFGVELMRRGFVSAEEVEVTLGLPVLATISQFEHAMPGAAKTSPWKACDVDRPFLRLPMPDRADIVVAPEVVAMWYPRSVVAEQYRVAATRLGLMVARQKSLAVVIISAVMGEGKTSTSMNMAHVISRDLNRKTVLVDCDLKRPMVQAYAGIESGPGLVEVLLGRRTVEECLQYHEQLGIWILPAGIEQSGTAALKYSDRLSELIDSLRARFDYIVIDAPPLLPVAESLLIVRLADIIAYVVRARSTGRDLVDRALKMIGEEKPIGVVLNGVDIKDQPYSYYSYANRIYESQHKQIS